MPDTPNSAAPQPALIFIPDISGFTQFVSEVAANHSQHIIEELLETIMDANEIGLEVSEVEGDAILFYRFGTAPTAAELLSQIQKMFVRFHGHLKKYETHRICNCGACRTAHDLSLKFVTHYGDITLNKIKQYQKLFGKDVIVSHRLLKNEIADSEYVLVTHQLVQACPQWVDMKTASWAPIKEGSEVYDSGPVQYCYLSLSPLLKHVPDPAIEDYSIPGVRTHIARVEAHIEAPLETVFNVIIDLPWRNKWIPETLPKVVDINSDLTQEGQTHRCLAKGSPLVSHAFDISNDVITFTETPQDKGHCIVYMLKRIDDGTTFITSDLFIKRNFLKRLVVNLFVKKAYLRVYIKAFENLNAYCRDLVKEQKEHPFWVVLDDSKHDVA